MRRNEPHSEVSPQCLSLKTSFCKALSSFRQGPWQGLGTACRGMGQGPGVQPLSAWTLCTRERGMRSTEGMVGLEERNSSSSEKVCRGARSVRIKARTKDMATKALWGT